MKKYFKILSLLTLIACFSACDDSNDLASPNENIGWIQFTGTIDDPDVFEYQQSYDAAARIGVNVQVPVVENDLTIGYSLVSVSGLNPNTAFSNSGSIISPAGESSFAGPDNSTGFEFSYLAPIVFDISELPILTEPMVFDVVLQSSSDSDISVGFNDEKPITQRITICPDVENLFLGEFAISSDGDAVADFGTGVSFGFGTVMISEGEDGPLSRTFDAFWLPEIGGVPVTIDFMISSDGFTVTSEDFASNLACGGVANAPCELGIGFGADPNPTQLSCGDDEFSLGVLEFKYLGDDPEDVDDEFDLCGSGGCVTSINDMNAPVSIILTKI